MVLPTAPALNTATTSKKRVKVRGHGFLWNSWLWFSWFIGPVAFVLRSMCGVEGWESLFALLFSPIIVPALGLFGALPRFILKRRGHRSIPVWVGVSTVVSAWGLVMIFMSMKAATDSQPIDSVAKSLFDISDRAEAALLTAGFTAWVVAYLISLVFACALKPSGAKHHAAAAPEALRLSEPPSVPELDRHARRADLAALIAAVLTPVLLVGFALVVDTAAMNGARDFGGAQESDVAHLTVDEQRARQAAQWEEAQETLAPLRETVATDGWQFLGQAGINAERTGLEPRGYTIDTNWQRALSGDPISVMNRVAELAEQAGWKLQPRDHNNFTSRPDDPGVVWEDDAGKFLKEERTFIDDRGYLLTIYVESSEASDTTDATDPNNAVLSPIVRLALTSGDYWQSRGDQFDWFDLRETGEALPVTFAGDEWPTLNEVSMAKR